MEIILKIELNRLTDEAKTLLLQLIALLEPKPLQTKTEEKISIEDPKPVKKSKAEKQTVLKTEPVQENTTPLTLEKIRDKVIALRDAGKKDKTLAVMQDFAIAKLSDLEQQQYPGFMDTLNKIE